MPRVRKIKISNSPTNISRPKRDHMTKFKFVMSVLWGTVAILVFTLIFTIYAAIIYLGHINANIARSPFQNNSTGTEVVYSNDKPYYRQNEMINLDIINNANESIYLAPCQYFNKFEKKLLGKWQSISIVDCEMTEVSTDTVSIEKISKKAEESIMAKKLGEGVWRGVSTVYFGCQKTSAITCKNSQKIYTNEFVIGEPNFSVYSNPQL